MGVIVDDYKHRLEPKNDHKLDEMRYFKVWFDGCAGYKMCIRGVREPTIEEANKFLAEDVKIMGGKVCNIDELTFDEAKKFFSDSVDNGKNWPVFGVSLGDQWKYPVEQIVKRENDTRPSWEEYFLKLAKDVATRSNCSRRKVGAIIVKDNHIVATGYNGTPHGTTNCFSGGCPRCNGEHKTGEKLDECLCVHAEQNAICQSAKYGNAIDGGSIYITCSPCLTCLKLIINAGIRKVVFSEVYREFNEQEKNLIKEAGIEVIHYGR